ncbi:MAG: hypothetical protein NWT08_13440 [Akkermansiaceae bacterium]|jgi:predicted nuclease with TOPRIM domain|nr:hypothetical protein [Akkermansiaceae bacterium]MDP4647645.1 hypothetical protein [Akkermansiaceae bacterium]MDP4722296.1 hypothetical protein [Akkermansiaceae bacterium]MDP4780336.1 hypothetical protein [Akkermansiaceae bacterium]MDP4846180.1 hypothetical protein [Akkermansiaceae bacterium]
MANILGIFTALILCVAAFVAVKNKASFEAEIAERDSQQRSLERSQKRLEGLQADLVRLPKERAEIDGQTAVKNEEKAGLEAANDSLKSDIESKTSKIEDNNTELNDIREKVAKVGDIEDLADKMKAMGAEREELTQNISSTEANLANLTATNISIQADAKNRKEELDTLAKGQSLPSLNTRILRIYSTWGFVLLADGDNAGVTANSTLDVVRGGEVIAKLLVTAVESRAASASIVPGSIAEDVTLMTGDRVVASKDTDTKKTASN